MIPAWAVLVALLVNEALLIAEECADEALALAWSIIAVLLAVWGSKIADIEAGS